MISQVFGGMENLSFVGGICKLETVQQRRIYAVRCNRLLAGVCRQSITQRELILFHQLEITGLPDLVEPGMQRAIEPQQIVSDLTLHGLNPVALVPLSTILAPF